MIIIYLLALFLNYRNILKCRGRTVSSLFLLIKDLVFILMSNIIFYYLAGVFKISFSEIKIFVFIWSFSLVLYFLKFKFICITYSGFVCYILSLIFGIEVSLSEILFLVGSLHVFEGIYVVLNSNFKFETSGFGKLNLYLPIFINGFRFIFFIFYRRGCSKLEHRGFKNFSGSLVILYGVISMCLSIPKINGFLGFIIFSFIILIHGFIDRMDEVLYLNFKKVKTNRSTL